MSDTAGPGRCLALIGGLGPGATVHYYRELIAGHERRGRVPRLLIAHADIHRVYACVIAKDFDGLARYLKVLPLFDGFRRNPEFVPLLAELNLDV